MQAVESGLWRERHTELVREAENERLARRLRKNGHRRGARNLREHVRAPAGLAPGRSTDRATGIEVRWGTPVDGGRIGQLLELNETPRREGAVVAERGREVLAAVRYRTENGPLFPGLLVFDPFVEERPFAEALYAGARSLARELGAREVRTRRGKARFREGVTR